MSSKKTKVLLVDDDETVRSIYVDVFKREGFEIIEARDGVEGLDKATREVPDVIFSGIIMPRMDGFALKDALTKNVATANIPMLMLSHMGREEDRKKAYSLGVKDFIVQGMTTPKQVVEKINAMFGSGYYNLKFNPASPDASRLAADLRVNPSFRCETCQGDLVLSLKIINPERQELSAKFVCPNCGDKNS